MIGASESEALIRGKREPLVSNQTYLIIQRQLSHDPTVSLGQPRQTLLKFTGINNFLLHDSRHLSRAGWPTLFNESHISSQSSTTHGDCVVRAIMVASVSVKNVWDVSHNAFSACVVLA